MTTEKLYLVNEYTEIREVSCVEKGANLIELDILKSQNKGSDNMTTEKVEQLGDTPEIKIIEGKDGTAFVPEIVDQAAMTMRAEGITVCDEEVARLNKEREDMLAEFEKEQTQNQTLKTEIAKVESQVGIVETNALEIELKHQENENLRLKIEQLKRENEELKANVGNAKGFTRQFSQQMSEDVKNEKLVEEELKKPTANLATAQNILNSGFKTFIN